jgi:hypothetical protein
MAGGREREKKVVVSQGRGAITDIGESERGCCSCCGDCGGEFVVEDGRYFFISGEWGWIF